MSDSQGRKAYSIDMKELPDGVISQPSMTSPKGFVPNFVRGTPEAESLTNPYTADDAAALALGDAIAVVIKIVLDADALYGHPSCNT